MSELASSRSVALLVDSLDGRGLVFGNERGDGFRYAPERLAVSLLVSPTRRRYPGVDRVRLVPPEGWRLQGAAERLVGEGETIDWTLAPAGPPSSCRQTVRCELWSGDRRLDNLAHPLALEIRGRGQFDPRRHALPFRNALADLGRIVPSRGVFDRTYRSGAMILPGAFFRGLYRDIVFLSPGPDGGEGGGLCTGMARFALERSLAGAGEGRMSDGTAAREGAQVWHGRQLTDGALLAAAPWFFAPSPARAFARFRAQLLADGRSHVAFDVGIARWRPALDTLRRLVHHGHTVVPYAFQQGSDDAATVFVYDPSYPFPEDLPHNVVRFDLARDRYAYRGFGSLAEDDGTTVIAVDQEPFREPGSAWLASLVSLILHPDTVLTEARENPAVRRNGALVLAGLLGVFALGCLRRRSPLTTA